MKKKENILEVLAGKQRCHKKGCRKNARMTLFGIGYCKEHLLSVSKDWLRNLEDLEP